MTFSEVLTQHPAWVAFWLNWLMVGAFVLPVVLIFWKQSRWAGVIALLSSVLSGLCIYFLFTQLGHVKLLGLPHIVFWVPLLFYLNGQRIRRDMPVWPRRIISVIMVTLIASLAFDTIATMQYLLGDRGLTALPA